jgi:hypothetical protein
VLSMRYREMASVDAEPSRRQHPREVAAREQQHAALTASHGRDAIGRGAR